MGEDKRSNIPTTANVTGAEEPKERALGGQSGNNLSRKTN